MEFTDVESESGSGSGEMRICGEKESGGTRRMSDEERAICGKTLSWGRGSGVRRGGGSGICERSSCEESGNAICETNAWVSGSGSENASGGGQASETCAALEKETGMQRTRTPL